MRTFVSEGIGRHIVIHLGKGEKILEAIESEVQRLDIHTGVITSCIGSLRKVVYHRIADTKENPTNEFFTIEAPIEMGAIQGVIIDSVPHLHISFCDREQAYAGHLEYGCEVQYLAEISILELLNADYVRKVDEFGISYIDAK